MKTQEVSVDKIEIGPRFRKDLGDLDDLTDSIKKKGVIQPITLDTEFKLIAGERRLAAVKALGLKKISALIRKVDDEKDAREIELFENIHRKDMTWQERAQLEKRIFDLEEGPKRGAHRRIADSLGTTRSNVSRHLRLAEAMEIIPELAECKTEKEAWRKFNRLKEKVIVKELAGRKRTKDAFKWADTHYRIGDCITELSNIKDNMALFAEVDPPYAIGLAEKKRRTAETHDVDIYNEWTAGEYKEKLTAVAKQVYRVIRPDSFCIWWFGPSFFEQTKTVLKKAGFTVGEIPGIWYKGPIGQTNNPDTVLASSYEMFFIIKKGKPILGKKGRSNVFHYSPVPARHKIHPTERPLPLMVELLDTFMLVPGIVCIPFLGSGVTLRATYARGHSGFGYDLVEENKDRFIAKVSEEFNEEKEKESGTEKE